MTTTLAELSDVEDRLGRDLTDTETGRTVAALRDASAVVRRYTRRTFTAETTTQRLRPVGYTVRLLQRPVTAVTAVSVIGDGGTAIPIPAWAWDGGSELWVYGDSEQVINLPEAIADLWAYRTPMVEVTYTHGFAEIPDDVVAVVAGKAVVALSLPASGGGVMSSETADAYSYQLAGFARSGPLGLSQADREILNAYRPGARSIELRG